MAKVRVLRLMEYIYDDQETAAADQGRWNMPAIGWHRLGNMLIRSTILTDLNFGEEDPAAVAQAILDGGSSHSKNFGSQPF